MVKSCPFGCPVETPGVQPQVVPSGKQFVLTCKQCGAAAAPVDTKEGAVAQWNGPDKTAPAVATRLQ